MRALPLTDLAFFDTAPVRITSQATLRASPERVWGAFADPATWTSWFPRMHTAHWVGETQAQVGAEREVRLRLLGNFRERFLAWEPQRRFAFTMSASTSPLARRLAEDFRFSPGPGGTTIVDWTFAVEPNLLGKLTMPLMRGMMKRMFRDAGAGLERYLGV